MLSDVHSIISSEAELREVFENAIAVPVLPLPLAKATALRKKHVKWREKVIACPGLTHWTDKYFDSSQNLAFASNKHDKNAAQCAAATKRVQQA